MREATQAALKDVEQQLERNRFEAKMASDELGKLERSIALVNMQLRVSAGAAGRLRCACCRFFVRFLTVASWAYD